jgi:alanine racemase
MRPTYALINLAHLRYNFLQIRKRVKSSKIMAVVKADAYGHGMLKCVEAYEKLGFRSPEYYGVALTEEAVELRKSGLTKKPILTFSPFRADETDEYINYKIAPTVCSENILSKLRKMKTKAPVSVHINIDTGMGRLGIHHSRAVDFVKSLASRDQIKISGIYTHFATSDESDKSYAGLQLKRFQNVISELKSLGIKNFVTHAANSGAILDMPGSYMDMVRPGISLYGYYPSLETSESIVLKPVMSLLSSITSIKSIRKGESVSYGRKFTADSDTHIASVPAGYADGVNRLLTNRMRVIIKDKLFNQVGRVTMDRILINIKNHNLKEGNKVILIGKSGDAQITAWDWSGIMNTIPYEITCNISKRVPRKYKG